jgi:hypothetical protein
VQRRNELVVVVALNETVLPADMKNGGKIDVLGEQLAVSSVIVELEEFLIWYWTVATVAAAVIASFAVSVSASVLISKQPTNTTLATKRRNFIVMRTTGSFVCLGEYMLRGVQ